MGVGRIDPTIQPYFVTVIREWERAILCTRACIVAWNQIILLLIGCDDSSLVIDKLCDEAVEGDPIVVCFYFDFAARNEQSPVNMLGSLLRQLVGGEGEIPEVIGRDFRKEKRFIGGRGLQVSRVLEMFQTITATRRTFMC